MDNWYVIRTRPRWEKKVAKQLQEKGVEAFCPLVKTRRQWSDRVKTIQMPLFKSLLFVRIEDQQRTTVRLTDGVMNFENRNGRPVMVREKLVRQIRQFQEAHPEVVALLTEDLEQKKGMMATSEAKGKIPVLCIESLGIHLVAGLPCSPIMEASTDKL